MFGQNRDQLRRFYLDCWQKQQQGELLAGIELIVAQCICQLILKSLSVYLTF